MGWWSDQVRKSRERKEQARQLAERNAITERQNEIRRHVYGHILGLGRPLTRSESIHLAQSPDLVDRYNEYLREAANAGDANAKWMVENHGLETSLW